MFLRINNFRSSHKLYFNLDVFIAIVEALIPQKIDLAKQLVPAL